MTSKKSKAKRTESSANPTVDAIKDSASQIWLAGLGAFAKAQAEGEKMFDTLVRQGQRIEKKSRSATQSRVDDVREAVENTVSDVQEKATDTWDKLEQVFESRVARVMGRLGVPTDDQVDALTARVRSLESEVARLRRAAAKPAKKKAASKKTTRKATAKKATTKKKAKKKSKKKS